MLLTSCRMLLFPSRCPGVLSCGQPDPYLSSQTIFFFTLANLSRLFSEHNQHKITIYCVFTLRGNKRNIEYISKQLNTQNNKSHVKWRDPLCPDGWSDNGSAGDQGTVSVLHTKEIHQEHLSLLGPPRPTPKSGRAMVTHPGLLWWANCHLGHSGNVLQQTQEKLLCRKPKVGRVFAKSCRA